MVDKHSKSLIDSLVEEALQSLRPRLVELAEQAFEEGRSKTRAGSRRTSPTIPTIKQAVIEALRGNARGLSLRQIVPYVRAAQGKHAASDESIRVTLHKMDGIEIERNTERRWTLKQ